MSRLVHMMVPRRREPSYAKVVRRTVWSVVVVLGLAASAPVLAAVMLMGGDDVCRNTH